ncbi:FdtA/QdtA family cupin domain-containing protein [uncultured Desulfovibrio sp.]|uniref:sugar 3,4-ketoisomerase n=1 Tax=uncultured Desulfovibrio sp. TaxID=167968 RepID=UPI00266CF03F|nr:FdtA/QdtA family cupin domain-containing protein [uncultured Desulfovibrio sp.]
MKTVLAGQHLVSPYCLVSLTPHGDERGKLISIESFRNISFGIKRFYYIYDTDPDWVRGKHAHSNLEQLVIAIDGACRFVLDTGKVREEIWLNRPNIALYIGKYVWREMHDFSYGCKLLVLASEYYQPEEYIRTYDNFIQLAKEQK